MTRTMLGASLKMVMRDRQAIFWALAFPMIFLGVFRLFSFGGAETTDVVVVADTRTQAGAALVQSLNGVEFLRVRVEPGLSEEQALAELLENRADVALLLTPAAAAGQPAQAQLIDAINDPIGSAVTIAAIRSVIDGTNLALTGVPRAIELSARTAEVERTTFFQFLGPGIIGMGLMTFATISLAGSLSRYREEGVLRRIRATPLPPWRFFGSLVGSYVLLAVVQIVLLVLFATAMGADVLQGVLGLALFALVGNLVFLNLGVVVAGLVQGRNAVEGAANAITFPMMFLSGSFFPTSALPELVQRLVELLPLTHMLRAMRAVSLDGASVWSQAPELGVLLAWVALSALLARAVFRLQDA